MTRIRFEPQQPPTPDVSSRPRYSRRTNKAGQSTPNKKVKPNNQKRTKPGRNGRIPVTTFGVKAPRNFEHTVELDKKNKNSLWQDSVEKEVAALIFHFTSVLNSRILITNPQQIINLLASI